MTMKRISAIALAASLLPATYAFAQTEAPAPAPEEGMQMQQEPAPGGHDFSDEELQSFAMAAMEVQTITEQYLPQLQETDDPEQQQQLRAEANEQITQAIESHGVSPEQYNAVAQQVQQDPALAQEISQYMQQPAPQ